MLTFLIGLFTIVLVLDCLFLILLVLVQLPKKEAGAGMAFGGAATDALFGAGSGNVLTKVTKYATGIFFVLVLGLAILGAQQRKSGGGFLSKEKWSEGSKPASAAPALPLTSSTNASVTPTLTTNAATSTAPAVSTNAPAK